jgi:hypothetical protein
MASIELQRVPIAMGTHHHYYWVKKDDAGNVVDRRDGFGTFPDGTPDTNPITSFGKPLKVHPNRRVLGEQQPVSRYEGQQADIDARWKAGDSTASAIAAAPQPYRGTDSVDHETKDPIKATNSNSVAYTLGRGMGFDLPDDMGGSAPGWGRHLLPKLTDPSALLSPVQMVPLDKHSDAGDGSAGPGVASQADGSPPVSPDAIVKVARSHMGHGYYGQAPISRDMGSLTFKDHQFVGDVLTDAGAGDFRHPHKRPEIAAWADPSADIPGWNVVDPPARKGDVLAMVRPNNDGPFGTRHGTMGIATGDGDSIAVTNGDSISRGDIGLRDGDEATIRRYANLDDGADGDPAIRRYGNLDTADDAFA